MTIGPAYGGTGGVGGIDVTVENPAALSYIFGDAGTDGSIRLLPDALGSNVEFQFRSNGVWNDTGIQIASDTVHLGRELRMSAAGKFLHTRDASLEEDALIPRSPFDPNQGTTGPSLVPVLDSLVHDIPLQSDFSSEVVGPTYSAQTTNPVDGLNRTIHIKTGSVAATAPVVVSYYRGSAADPDKLFWRRIYHQSVFGADLDVDIELIGLVEVVTNESVFVEYTSAADFSLRTNALGEAYALLDVYAVAEEEIVTVQSGLDRVVTTPAGVATVDGNLVTI